MDVHLLDGTYELFRAFYGAPSATAPDGREVGASRALARSLLALLRTPGVTHLGCAFDHVIESFRNQLFPGYKTSDGIDPALWEQFPLAERVAAALGVVVWPMVEFEADDAMATFAARADADPRVGRVLLCTPDKDLSQCVRGDRVVACDWRSGARRDEAGVVEKFGVLPESIPDWLALVGDTADGIPGVPRWGPKSAAVVLARHRHVEAIPDEAARWDVTVRGAEALAASLRAHRAEAALYRTLATLRTDAPLTESVDDLAWRGAHRDEVARLAAELGDSELVGRVHAWA